MPATATVTMVGHDRPLMKTANTVATGKVSAGKRPKSTGNMPTIDSLKPEKISLPKPVQRDAVLFGVPLSLPFKEQRERYKRTVLSFSKSGAGGLARLYRLVGGCVVTRWRCIGRGVWARHGRECFFDANKRVVRQRRFVNGVQHGDEQIWCYIAHEASTVESESMRVELKTLVYSCGFDSGVKSGVEMIHDVTKHSEDAVCFRHGSRIRIVHYTNGKKHGMETCVRHGDGRVLHECSWTFGVKHGVERQIYSNGVVSCEIPWSCGKKCGIQIKRDRQNRVIAYTTYASGFKHGDQMRRSRKTHNVVCWQWNCGVRITSDGKPFEWH